MSEEAVARAISEALAPRFGPKWTFDQLPPPVKECLRNGARAAIAAMQSWRPFTEEPDRPMRVLVFTPDDYHPEWNGADYGLRIGYYGGPGDWRDQGTNHDLFEDYRAPHFPTHWMPLPPPPQEKL